MSSLPQRQTLFYAVMVFALALVWSYIAVWCGAQPGPSVDFIYGEPGQNLFIADRLNAGATLYRDVFTQYGPLPLLAYAAVTRVFGNSGTTYLAVHQALSIVGCVLLFLVFRRSCSVRAAAAWTVGAMFPCFLMPGSLNDNPSTLYPGFERLSLLLLALIWVHPLQRSLSRSLTIGLILGSMQLCKFGTAIVIGMALLLTDLVTLGVDCFRSDNWRQWLKAQFATLGGFLVVEALWAAWLFKMLPAAWAIDVLWPYYVVKSYRSYLGADLSYWHWFNRGYFVVAQLPIVIGFALSAFLICRQVASRSVRWLFREGSSVSGPQVFLALCLPVALAIHFLPHRYAILPWVWLPVAAAAGAAVHLRPIFQVAVALALAPSFFITAQGRVRAVAQQSEPTMVRMPTANGEKLWASKSAVERFDKVQQEVAEMHRRRGGGVSPPRVVAFNLISGWEHYFGYQQHGSRHAWLITSFVRPEEEAALVASLDDSSAVLLHSYANPITSEANAVSELTSDPRSWGRFCNPGLSDTASEAFARKLGPPVMVDDWCAVFPVR